MSTAKTKKGAQYALVPMPTGAVSANMAADLRGQKRDATYYNNPVRGASGNRHTVTNWAHYVHVNAIIENRWFYFDNPLHRNMLSYYHDFYHAFIYKVAAALCEAPPRFIRQSADEDDPEPPEDEAIADEWNRLNLTDMLRKFVEEDRKHGWAVYAPFATESLPPYFTGNPWNVFSACEATEYTDKRDKWGHPTLWSIQPANTHLQQYDLSIRDCVFYNSEQTNDYLGVPAGLHLWDLMIDYVFILEAMKSFDQRLGNGFMVLPLDQNATDAEETDAKAAIRALRTEMGLTVRQSPGNALKPEWLSPQPGSDFVEHLSKYEELFAAGMGFPVRWLKGDPQGAVESGQSDLDQIQIRLRQIFNKYVPFIKRVLIYHGLINSPEEIDVLPGLSLELSDLQKASVEQIKTETINMKQWLTNNEKRELDGYGALSEDEEGKLLGGPMQEQEAIENDAARGQKEPAAAKGDAYGQIAAAFRRLPVRALSEMTGLSAGSVSKVREKFDLEARPVCKTDAWGLKCDSVVDDVLEAEGPLITPAELQYPDSPVPDYIPPEAIREWFESNTPKELHIGITPSDDHTSPVPLEVLRDASVGTARAERLENGAVIAKYRIDLKAVDKVLGPDNWVRAHVLDKKDLPLSIARWSKDRLINGKRVNTAIDVRSVVLTRSPRNPATRAAENEQR